MRTFSMKQKRSIMWILLLFVSALWSGNLSAADNLGELELNKKYQLQNMVEAVGTFTAPATGELIMYAPISAHLFTDPNYKSPLNGGYNNNTHTYNVVEGITYYFNYDGFAGDATLELIMPSLSDVPMRIVTVYPIASDLFSLALDSKVEIRMNQTGFTYDSVDIWLTLADGTKTTRKYTNVSSNGEYLSLNAVNTYMTNQLNSGMIKPLSPFGFTIKGLKNKNGTFLEGTEDGNYSIEYTISSIPVTVTTENFPTEILSYWPKGDPAGIITLEFSENIQAEPAPICQLSGGNAEGELGVDKYIEEIPTVVEGNKLTVDLTGKRRNLDDMFSTTTGGNRFDISTMTLDIFTIRDTYGIPIQTSGAGSVGSVGRSLPFRQLDKANVACDPWPMNGDKLTDNAISIWISGIRSLHFDGFTVEYTINGIENKALVSMADVTVTTDASGDSATYDFSIPDEAVTASKVTIYPTNLVSTDGYDYDHLLNVTYNSLTVTFLEPAIGSSFPMLAQDTEILAEFNYAETYPEMYVMYQIVDLDAESEDYKIVKSPTWMNRQASGEYTSTVLDNIRMFQGHTYEVQFTAWETEMDFNYGVDPIGETSVVWFGLTAPYKFSLLSLVSITPSTDTTLTVDDREFTLTFDGTVNLSPETTFINAGQGITEPFASIKAVGSTITVSEETNTTYSNEWKLTVSEDYMKNLRDDLYLTVVPVDETDRRLKGNAGLDDGSYFSFVYQSDAGYVDFFVEPDGSQDVCSIREIIVGSELGIAYGWNPDTDIVVYNNARSEVARVINFVEKETAMVNGEEAAVKITCELNEPITTAGDYRIEFPRGAFNIGAGFDTFLTLAKTVNVYVTGPEGVETITEATDFWTVYNLQGIMVVETNNYDTVKALAPGVYIVNGVKTVIR